MEYDQKPKPTGLLSELKPGAKQDEVKALRAQEKYLSTTEKSLQDLGARVGFKELMLASPGETQNTIDNSLRKLYMRKTTIPA